jgi:hypothetical protein
MIAMGGANSFEMMGKLLGLFHGRSCQLVDRVYTNSMKVTAVVHKADEGGFWAEVPSLPGCRTQGDSMDELKANLREAVELPVSPQTKTPSCLSWLFEADFWRGFLSSTDR